VPIKLDIRKGDILTENQSLSGNVDVFYEVFLPMLLAGLGLKKTPPQVRKHCEGEKKSIY
jgi:hypothetical protein